MTGSGLSPIRSLTLSKEQSGLKAQANKAAATAMLEDNDEEMLMS